MFKVKFLSILSAFCASISLVHVNAQTVIAHFMAQNSYSYVQADWAADIKAAQDVGIEGFALNVAVDDYEVSKMPDAFRAAESSNNFKLLFSFDMNYPWESAAMVSLLSTYAKSPAMYRWKDGKVLVSTFNGESKGDAFWKGFKNELKAKGVEVTLAPAFTGYRDVNRAQEMLGNFPSIDGFFNWWSWPDGRSENLTSATDLAYKSAISSRGGPYIMSVSPWQFKELGGDMNWVEQSDYLWKYRWEQAINEVKPDIVEIVTWNDYGESHYIADVNPKVDLGDLAPKYVVGFEHSAWRTIAKYYIQWFKTGSAPKITEDRVIYWYRTHPKSATCSQGTLPRNSNFPADIVVAFSMLTSPAKITLDIGSSHAEFNAPAGVAIGSVPFSKEDNQTPSFGIVRDGKTVKSGKGGKAVTKACEYYNFNPTVGAI